MPMAPAPMMIMLLGCGWRTIASRLPMTVFPLNGRPGSGRLVTPVATKMRGAVSVSVLPSPALAVTAPALSIKASARM